MSLLRPQAAVRKAGSLLGGLAGKAIISRRQILILINFYLSFVALQVWKLQETLRHQKGERKAEEGGCQEGCNRKVRKELHYCKLFKTIIERRDFRQKRGARLVKDPKNFVDENLSEAFKTLNVYQKCLEQERDRWVKSGQQLNVNSATAVCRALRKIYAITKQNMDLLDKVCTVRN